MNLYYEAHPHTSHKLHVLEKINQLLICVHVYSHKKGFGCRDQFLHTIIIGASLSEPHQVSSTRALSVRLSVCIVRLR